MSCNRSQWLIRLHFPSASPVKLGINVYCESFGYRSHSINSFFLCKLKCTSNNCCLIMGQFSTFSSLTRIIKKDYNGRCERIQQNFYKNNKLEKRISIKEGNNGRQMGGFMSRTNCLIQKLKKAIDNLHVQNVKTANCWQLT